MHTPPPLPPLALKQHLQCCVLSSDPALGTYCVTRGKLLNLSEPQLGS